MAYTHTQNTLYLDCNICRRGMSHDVVKYGASSFTITEGNVYSLFLSSPSVSLSHHLAAIPSFTLYDSLPDHIV